MGSSGVLSINLAAVQANWQLLSRQCASDTQVGAVIKANAYGLGAQHIGRALYLAGCRAFFFANKDEALPFCHIYPHLDLFVIGGASLGDETLFIESGLIPVLFSVDAIDRWAKACRRLNLLAPSVIKVNTGMTRLGLSLSEFTSLCNNHDLLQAINPVIIMSHLACADEYHHPLNREQLVLFKSCVDLIKHQLPHVRFSLANSAGIFLGKEWHFDLLRPGAALYGINPVRGSENPLQSVIKLSLPILQIRTLDEDAFIGYGAGTKVKKGTRLAVVAGGYADGLHRTLGLHPEGYLDGKHIKAVGRISMDSIIFDISCVNRPDSELINQFVEVINDRLSIDYLMQKNNSLGYEVLTSLGNRYQRVYPEKING